MEAHWNIYAISLTSHKHMHANQRALKLLFRRRQMVYIPISCDHLHRKYTGLSGLRNGKPPEHYYFSNNVFDWL